MHGTTYCPIDVQTVSVPHEMLDNSNRQDGLMAHWGSLQFSIVAKVGPRALPVRRRQTAGGGGRFSA